MAEDKSERLETKRRRRVQSRIEEIALGMFEQRSFDEVSLNEITDALGISKRSFFRYFDSKDDIALSSQRRGYERFLTLLEQRPPEEGPVTALRNTLVEATEADSKAVEMLRTHSRLVQQSPKLHVKALGEQVRIHREVAKALIGRQVATDGESPAANAPERAAIAETIAFAMMSVAAVEWNDWLESEDATHAALVASRIEAKLDMLCSGLSNFDESAPERFVHRNR